MIKSFNTQQRVEGRTVMGYCAVHGNRDFAGDVIQKGAFARSLNDNGPGNTNRIPMLLQHDKKLPLGKPSVLKEDSYGLYHETYITETSFGNDTLVNIKAGVLDGMSIGYEVIKQTSSGNAMLLKELRLAEYSIVTFPCNDLARVTDLKEDLYNAVDGGDEENAAELLAQITKQYPTALSEEEEFAYALNELIDDRFPESSLSDELLKLFNHR